MKKAQLHDVADEVYKNMHGREFVPPVQSLLDIDFYKLTMGQVIHRFYPDVEVTFKLIVRDKAVRLWKYVDIEELRKALEYVSSLSIGRTDISYLRGTDLYGKNMFGEDYINFLKGLRLSGFKIERVDGAIELTFKARWCEVTYWETIAMAIISELYYRGIMKNLSEQEVHDIHVVMDNRLQSDILEIKKDPNITFSDFGTRRRNGFLWQKYVVGEAKRVLGSQFSGTSDTYLAFHHDIDPKGTNAHELPMVLAALANTPEEMRASQYEVLKVWQEVYGQALRIILPDTFGSEQFFANAPDWVSTWTGQRQDSGVPSVEGERYMKWLESKNVDPKGKVTIFSDGLSVPAMKNISNHFKGKHITPYGWGTLLTNNTKGVIPGNDDFRPFSMVIKVVEADSRPCVKLSNDISKATGPSDEISRYIEVFGGKGRGEYEVVV